MGPPGKRSSGLRLISLASDQGIDFRLIIDFNHGCAPVKDKKDEKDLCFFAENISKFAKN